MAVLVNPAPPPCILHEDEHLLVINKPAGLNTHSPSPYSGEGIYDWLRNREPRWAHLAIVHRLDKTTSGLLVFAKTKLANQSLTQEFTARHVRKRYLLLATASSQGKSFTVKSGILRSGDRYIADRSGQTAETKFTLLKTLTPPPSHASQVEPSELYLFAAEPVTGRTHQIRVHAELNKIPILGDRAYGGRPFPRVCLHAAEITMTEPGTQKSVTFRSEADFFAPPHLALRSALIEPDLTNAFRLVHGAADSHAGVYVDRFGGCSLMQASNPPAKLERGWADSMNLGHPTEGSVYFKLLKRSVGETPPEEAQPQLWSGKPAPDPFTIIENGVRYETSFQQGYSVGLFLDQRDNRRRLLKNYVGLEFPLFERGLQRRAVLNAFAYTCAFSVCAALAGAHTTSLDLSRKYLDWGRRNFLLNDLDPAAHDFIFGDFFAWAGRLARKSRLFDVILLDPPTFSRSKLGVFQAEKHYSRLVSTALPLLRPNGILFASTNASRLTPERFLEQVRSTVAASRRRILKEVYIPQPPDFPISREEPAHLKTVWLRIA